MLMILARLVRSESFWAVAKVRSPHTGPEFGYPRDHHLTYLHIGARDLLSLPSLPTRCLEGGGEEVGLS